MNAVNSTRELWEKKWKVFAKRARIFRYIPFVEFVLLAGSMATGKVHKNSDFDVIVGARERRVWSAWFFSTVFLQLRRWREHPGVNKSNRIALTHFASPGGYKLSEPYNAYWDDLYQRLVPVMGSEEKMKEFFEANYWLKPPRRYERSKYYLGNRRAYCKRFLEFILGRGFGNFVERFLKKRLVKVLENPEKLGYKPRLVYNGDKLEIYRDTRRIEEMLDKKRG